ncbi:cytochrome P450 [Thermosporothrix hazakensis]|uniref:Cytochrome P450 n=2 Tax=Thermosporothrix TaxID=768650 RepID=A0A326U3K7_THEHA|nr:cytochrome P450 [Thermosporothrix hazakensis]PZW26094.1 cytochrome P450 [Thermosporothrix hazakensis]BBH87067.1 cytochrome P450 [Thermosporothrix sp. COM3]GCE51353.1 cytochrome P450 [Thermosporothrix hazakensis]
MATLAARSIPGPKVFPLLGWRSNLVKAFYTPFFYLPWLHKTYGNIATLAAGNLTYVVVFGPENNFKVLSNPDCFEVTKGTILERMPADSAFSRMMLRNVAMERGKEHRRLRRLMQPAFHRKMLTCYHHNMVEMTQYVLERWETQNEFELNQEMKRITLRIIIKALFGLYDERELERISTTIFQLNKAVPLALILPVNLPGTPYHQTLRLGEELEQFFLKLIEQKRSQTEATDVLAALIHAHDEDGSFLSEDELLSNTASLFLAGFETTMTSLTWVLFLLHQHPHILSDLLDELEGILQGNAPTPEQIAQMPLLDGVIKESLRLLPPGSVGARVTMTDCELEGYEIPAGTNILYSQFVTHRMPELYPEPNRFKPERWLTLKRTPYEYLPFGAGQHMCIGAGFAIYEMKIILSVLLQRYRLQFVPGTQVEPKVRMQPKYRLQVKAVPQDRRFERVPVRGRILELVDISDHEM